MKAQLLIAAAAFLTLSGSALAQTDEHHPGATDAPVPVEETSPEPAQGDVPAQGRAMMPMMQDKTAMQGMPMMQTMESMQMQMMQMQMQMMHMQMMQMHMMQQGMMQGTMQQGMMQQGMMHRGMTDSSACQQMPMSDNAMPGADGMGQKAQ